MPLVGGLGALGAFLAYERRAPDPMLPPAIFASRNFAIGNVVTLTVYAGLGAASFFIAIFLQQVAGYSAFEAGLALLPITLLLISLSRRFGALSARVGPRLLMSAGPLVGGLGLLAFTRVDGSGDYLTQVLPATLLFGLGLAMTVAPLTATVLEAADRRHAGIASGVNNAIARVAGLLAIAAVGARHLGAVRRRRRSPPRRARGDADGRDPRLRRRGARAPAHRARRPGRARARGPRSAPRTSTRFTAAWSSPAC